MNKSIKRLFGQDPPKSISSPAPQLQTSVNTPQQRSPSPIATTKPQPPGSAFVQRLIGLDSTNGTCADCGASINTNDAWTSINTGAILCIVCSGTHRGLGTHITKIRSLNLDALGGEVMWIVQNIGNGRLNRVLEARLEPNVKPNPNSMPDVRTRFAQAKYGQRQYAIQNPLEESSFIQKLIDLISMGDIGSCWDLLFSSGPPNIVSEVLKRNSSPLLIQSLGIQPIFLTREPSQVSLNLESPPSAPSSPPLKSVDPTRFAMAEFLMLNGVDVNTMLILAGRSTTALHCAVGAHDLEMLMYLLQRGADPMLRDDEGKLPVGKSKGEEKKLLLDCMSRCTPKP